MNSAYRHFNSLTEAYDFLEELGATKKLIRHVALVGEAAELLLETFKQMGVEVDDNFVRLGVAFHDAGKIIFPEELFTKGNNHEPSGQELLLEHGVNPELARCCLSHSRWQAMKCSLEELLVALADKLWKGKRDENLERLIIERVAQQRAKDVWDLFVQLDSSFEAIAGQGSERLTRS